MGQSYSRGMIALHWVMAALMVAAYLLGERMEDLPRGAERLQALVWHIYAGLLVALLLIPRLLARRAGSPAWPEGVARWQHAASALVHVGLYLVMALLLVSGVVAVTSGPRIPLGGGLTTPVVFPGALHEAMEEVHEIGAKGFLALAGVHVAAALWHFVRRDKLAFRMTPALRRAERA